MRQITNLRPQSRKGRMSSYDWPTILNGTPWEMTHGVDFTCKPSSLQTLIKNTARKQNLRAETRIFVNETGVDCIEVQASPKG